MFYHQYTDVYFWNHLTIAKCSGFMGSVKLEAELAKLSTTLPLVGSTVAGVEGRGVYDKVFRVYVLTGLSHMITCKVHFPSSAYHIVPEPFC